jgi:hypothetical protein
MIIKYKEPWCLNPDIISYGMNSGNILAFDNSNEYSFYIKFDLIGGPQDSISNIVWKGNDELGIQISDNQLQFTFRHIDNQNDKQNGILKFFAEMNNETSFEILVSGKDGENFIYINDSLVHSFGGKMIFSPGCSYNFGGGHADNIEYDLNELVIAKKMYYIDEIRALKSENEIDINILGCYDFNRKTEQKVWDMSSHFNLLNRFYL